VSGTITVLPERLRQLSDDLAIAAGDARAVGDEVDAALAAFRSSSSEFVPALPPHGVFIDDVADDVAALSRDTAVAAAAFEAVDRAGQSLGRALMAAWMAVKGATILHGGLEALGTLSRAVNAGVGAIWRPVRTLVHRSGGIRPNLRAGLMRWRWGDRPMPSMSAVRGRMQTRTAPRAQARREQLQQYRTNKAERRAINRDLARVHERLRTNPPLSAVAGSRAARLRGLADGATDPLRRGAAAAGGQLRRVGSAVAGTRVGGALATPASVVGRRLPVIGAVVGVADLGHAVAVGERERAVIAGVGTAGGALMLVPIPPVQIVGAVLVAGSVVYEHREKIADGARAVGDLGGRVAGGAARLVGGLF
jgi:hypothetical protein